jgi:predicted NAD/FAD-dependent oxidoreductase
MAKRKLPASVAVIGSGLAGLAGAARLRDAGVTPVLFDKGRRPGGRMATRSLKLPDGSRTAIDHGAQFVTARDSRFQAYLEQAGAVPWGTAGAGRMVGVPGNRRLVEAGLDGLNFRQECEVLSASRGSGGWHLRIREPAGEAVQGPFDAVLCTAPAVQASRLFPDGAQPLSAVRMAPCWAALLVFASSVDAPDLLQDDAEDAVLSWAAREGAKPGRAAQPERWILHAAPAWSRTYLEETAEAILPRLQAAFAARLGIDSLPGPILAHAHRWRFARVETPLDAPFQSVADGSAVLAGDWCLGPRAEAAHLSGIAAAEALLGAAE